MYLGGKCNYCPYWKTCQRLYATCHVSRYLLLVHQVGKPIPQNFYSHRLHWEPLYHSHNELSPLLSHMFVSHFHWWITPTSLSFNMSLKWPQQSWRWHLLKAYTGGMWGGRARVMMSFHPSKTPWWPYWGAFTMSSTYRSPWQCLGESIPSSSPSHCCNVSVMGIHYCKYYIYNR